MSDIQFENHYAMELASDLTAIATTITLKSGHGDAGCPAIETSEEKHFFITIVNNAGAKEIVKIIKRPSGSDVLTVGSSVADQASGNVSGRAQEGTSALAITYTDDHVIELRLTAAIMEWVANAIPAGEIILFEKDTAALGYTLQTDVDDGLVYITKGTGASGEEGGTAKSGGTWTQPGHTHTVSNHTHTVGSHTHTGPSHTHVLQSSGYYASGSIGVGTHQDLTLPSGTGATGGTALTTDAGGSGSSGSSATANTWRPTGRNFTRQQRN